MRSRRRRTHVAERAMSAAAARMASNFSVAVTPSTIMVERSQLLRVALDAMGGDHAPLAPVAGAVQAARAWGHEIQMVGRDADIRAALQQQGDLSGIEEQLQI